MSLTERLMKAAEEARLKAESLDGKAKEVLLDKARQFEAQMEMSAALQKSPG